MQARRIHVNGIVQGVGFRPYVARLARSLGCAGWVLNSAHGVEIFVQHEDGDVLGRFEVDLVQSAPPAAHILKIESHEVDPEEFEEFAIRRSEHDDAKSTLISPDLATCDDCLAELFDPDDRRYHYPFINCTNCGPRFTIIEDLPYDRPVTSMRVFEMCEECAAEYADDTDRRYHAQPDACFECGPSLWWAESNDTRIARQSIAPEARNRSAAAELAGKERPLKQSSQDRFAISSLQQSGLRNSRIVADDIKGSDALIDLAAERLEAGDVLAIKGLGGWHLSCDASNEKAVQKLRERKHRPSKPLAVMVRDLETACEYAHISDDEAAQLQRVERPIVLLKRRDGAHIAPNVAGDLPEIGLMLPSTPVQHLLLHATDRPLVMTSGNRSGEPIVAADEDAFEALGSIADGFLGNNRAIAARYDDSVLRVDAKGDVQMVRRARGIAPTPLLIENRSVPVIFAAGPEQKATFATLDGERVYVSQHLGDLERLGAWRAWEEARERYERLFDTTPQVIACDMHPEYLASKWAREQAAKRKLPLIEVQHHHAHIASVLGENELEGPVIGVALDGTGFGTDGTIWGGEILIATREDLERFWHLPTFQLPGGAAAIMAPERTAYALLRAYGELDDPFFSQFSLDNPQFAPFLEHLENRELLDQMLDKNLNSPLTSSAGRLFDAVSALLGICTHPTYDGEAACLLEAAAWSEEARNGGLRERAVKTAQAGCQGATIGAEGLFAPKSDSPLTAASFHEGFINAIILQVIRAREETGINDVALSGGCMVNRIVASQLRERLGDLGFRVYVNRELPPNDGCIAYGQAIIAQARLED